MAEIPNPPDNSRIAETITESTSSTRSGTDESSPPSVCHYRNVFETILEMGHDQDFVPTMSDEFTATDAPAGSRAKLDVMAERVRKGLPLHHPDDRDDYSGLTGLRQTGGTHR